MIIRISICGIVRQYVKVRPGRASNVPPSICSSKSYRRRPQHTPTQIDGFRVDTVKRQNYLLTSICRVTFVFK